MWCCIDCSYLQDGRSMNRWSWCCRRSFLPWPIYTVCSKCICSTHAHTSTNTYWYLNIINEIMCCSFWQTGLTDQMVKSVLNTLLLCSNLRWADSLVASEEGLNVEWLNKHFVFFCQDCGVGGKPSPRTELPLSSLCRQCVSHRVVTLSNKEPKNQLSEELL